MMPMTCLHNHTHFCDGKNTPAEMAARAYAMGCRIFGFSGHAHDPMEPQYSMSLEGTQAYIAQVKQLQKEYEGKMEIRLGIEYDTTSVCDLTPYEYLIASVHFVIKDGVRIPVDLSADELQTQITACYGGDALAFARDYFEQIPPLVRRTNAQIVGHFDLLTKFEERVRIFNQDDRRYRAMAIEALDAVLESDPIVEINTGGIIRGYRTRAYPAEFLLRRVAEKKGRVTITSDSHAVDHIMYGYADAYAFALACGIKRFE